MKIPEGYELNNDLNYKIKFGEKFYDKNGTCVGQASGFAGLTIEELARIHGCYIFKQKPMKDEQYSAAGIKIEYGYEEITNPNIVLEEGDKYYSYWSADFEYVEKKRIGQLRNCFSNDSTIIRPKAISPEEKIKKIKKQAKDFVKKNITNPSPEIYEKFELAFLRGDEIGL